MKTDRLNNRGACLLLIAILAALSGAWAPGQAGEAEAGSPRAVKGDLNNDGQITAADAAILAAYLAGTTNSLPAGADADMNSDTFTNNLDAVLLQRETLYDTIAGYLRSIATGSFNQGSPAGEIGRNADEGPQFTHTFTRQLLVMETSVTRQMWADLLAVQPTLPADPTGAWVPAQAEYPVKWVSWHQAVLFANLLSLEQGLTRCYYTDSSKLTPIDATNYAGNDTLYCDFTATGFRLPTEGEREYFCRAKTTTPFWKYESFYNISTCSSCVTELPMLVWAAWYCYNSGNVTQEVAGKQPNPWGLYDVHGNVWEWCWDWASDTYPTGAQTDYRGAASGSARVLRGGACDQPPLACRSAYRNWRAPNSPLEFYGFRLVRTGS